MARAVEPALHDFIGRLRSVGDVLANQFFLISDGAHPIGRRVSGEIFVLEVIVPGHVIGVSERDARQRVG